MTTSARWPAGIGELLNGDDLDTKIGLTLQLFTTGPTGWPHVALLSAGEVLIDGSDSARLALWPTTATSENLQRDRRASLGLVHDGAWWLARLQIDGTALLDQLPRPLLGVRAQLVELREERAPYARLTGGPTFDLVDPNEVLARWRSSLDALRRAQDFS